MRLLNASTLRLEEFPSQTPPYAILSHTWGDEEISFQDIQTASSNGSNVKVGLDKIKKACIEALTRSLQYVWVDTCCIDKSSSAELSEAINSMFRWYKEANCCFAYLADVNGLRDFSRSRWFERGWTLQELLAPAQVIFFNRDWVILGTKYELAKVVSDVAGIRSRYLVEPSSDVRHASIAERMYWASRRMTTRVEDIAYCLMGIFDVNMPLLYGEGERAFTRLQIAIMANSEDQSIFAWDDNQRHAMVRIDNGARLLACSPAEFLWCGGKIEPFDGRLSSLPYTLTNTGLHIQLPLYNRGDTAWAVLRCRPLNDFSHAYAIGLRRLPDGSYERALYNTELVDYRLWRRYSVKSIHVRLGSLSSRFLTKPHWSFVFRHLPRGFEISDVYPELLQLNEREILGASLIGKKIHWIEKALLVRLKSKEQGSFLVVLPSIRSRIGDRIPNVLITTMPKGKKLAKLADKWGEYHPGKTVATSSGEFRLTVEDYPEMVLWRNVFVIDIYLEELQPVYINSSSLAKLMKALTSCFTFLVLGTLNGRPTRQARIWLYRRNVVADVVTNISEVFPDLALIVALLLPLALPLPLWAVVSLVFLFLCQVLWPLLLWFRTQFELRALPEIRYFT
ncbi:hypothetical protein E8E14_007455 [Neopestalotiopsis sp. 37M]|nr:hypothetical protein E8E14_007455 [Neopestalotiopsis sp. 37M]